ncbi:MAG: Ig-like domain-containing protein [Candidatus Woesearchaeota archaeon]|nr:Ig-like domain-containing protein [Candidatus Woesearchaeota archaeon]
MKRLVLLVALLALTSVAAVEPPRGIDGHIYALDGITPVPRAVTVVFEDLNTSAVLAVYADRGPGRYSVALSWNNGHTVRITASNPVHSSSRDVVLTGIHHDVDLFLNMTLPDLPPVILSTPNVDAVQDQQYAYYVDTYEWNGQPIQHGLLAGPTGMTVNMTTGVIAWRPTAHQVGTHAVTYIATDGNLSTTQSFTITVQNVNDAPTFLSIPTTTVDQDVEWTYSLVAEDLDGDPISISFTGPTNMTLVDSLLSWTPGPYDVGEHVVNVTLSDGVLETSQTFLLTVQNIPDMPIILSTPPVNATEDVEYAYTIAAIDYDDDPLTVSVSGPTGMHVVGDTVVWVPENGAVGVHNITVNVSDGVLVATQQYALHVQNVNDPPIVPVRVEMPVLEQVALYQFLPVDPDGDALTMALVSGPAGLTISETGFIRYQPAVLQEFSFIVAVSDGTVNVTQTVAAELVSFKKFVQSGGGGGILEYFEEFLPPEEERLFERTYRFNEFIQALFVRANTIPDDIRLARVDVDEPMEQLVYGYFHLLLDGTIEGLEKAEVTFRVPQSWLAEHDITIEDVALYRYDGKWRVQRTALEGTTLVSSVRGLGLFAIAADALPKAQEPTVIAVPEPVTIIGKVIGGRANLPIVLTDLETGEQYRTRTGRGALRDVFEFVVHDVKGHAFSVAVPGLLRSGATEFVADSSLVTVELHVKGGLLGITGQVVGGEGTATTIELVLVLIITIALAVRFVRRRIQ